MKSSEENTTMKTTRTFNIVFKFRFDNDNIAVCRTGEMSESAYNEFLGHVEAYTKFKDYLSSLLNKEVQFDEIYFLVKNPTFTQLFNTPVVPWSDHIEGCKSFCEFINNYGIMGRRIMNVVSMKIEEHHNIHVMATKHVQL